MRSANLQVQQKTSYVDQATQGASSVWRYIAGTISILFIWLIIGSIATVILLFALSFSQGLNLEEIMQAVLDPQILGFTQYFLVVNIGFWFLLIATWFSVRVIHQRSLTSVITGRKSISWRRIGVGFILWLALILLGTLIEFLVTKEPYTLTFDARVFLPFALVAILVTPIQTTAEELFFRGYLVQAGSLINRNRVFLSIWSGFLFALPHILNPEVSTNFFIVMLTYFLLGAFLAWISLKDGTIELAIGVHASNNLAAGLLVTFPESALQSPAIFTSTDFNPLLSLISVVLTCGLFYLILFVRRGGAKTEGETEIVLE
jgi:membrane protease YdiL (CAAX protease family)